MNRVHLIHEYLSIMHTVRRDCMHILRLTSKFKFDELALISFLRLKF